MMYVSPNPEQVQVGMWLAYCCHEDLFEVTQDNIADVRADMQDAIDHDEVTAYMLWDTKKEALMYLSAGESPETLERLYELWGMPQSW